MTAAKQWLTTDPQMKRSPCSSADVRGNSKLEWAYRMCAGERTSLLDLIVNPGPVYVPPVRHAEQNLAGKSTRLVVHEWTVQINGPSVQKEV